VTNPSAAAFWSTAIAKQGVAVQIQRVSGFAPHTVAFTAEVTAVVRDVTPDSTAPNREGIGVNDPGAIPQTDRIAFVLGADLASAQFPLPLKIGDLMMLPDTDEKLKIVRVDPYLLASAGVVKAYVAGVA
jgi:hypothetical protein